MAEEILEEQEQTVEEQYYTYEISEDDVKKYDTLVGALPSVEDAPFILFYTEMCDRFFNEFKFLSHDQSGFTCYVKDYVDENAFREDVQKALVLLDEYYNKLMSWQPESEEQPIIQEPDAE